MEAPPGSMEELWGNVLAGFRRRAGHRSPDMACPPLSTEGSGSMTRVGEGRCGGGASPVQPESPSPKKIGRRPCPLAGREAAGDDAAASAPLLLSHWSCGNGCRVPELVDPAAEQRAHSSSHDAGPRLPGRVPV